MIWALIGMAGAAGAAARLLVADWAGRWRGDSAFPWGTLVVNICGSLLLGLLTGRFLGGGAVSPEIKLVLGTGFIGAFTTFSTWQMDVYRAYRRGDERLAWTVLLLSTGLGLLAAWVGVALGWPR